MRTGWRTRWQVWNHDRNEVFRIANYPNPVFSEMWLLTGDLFMKISIFIANLSERQHCWHILSYFQSKKFIQFFDGHRCIFMLLHFSIGFYDYRGNTQLRSSIHFSITHVFFFIKCIDAPESTTNSRSSDWRVDAGRHLFSAHEKECCFVFPMKFENTFGQPPHCFAGTLLLPLCLLLRRVLNFWCVGTTLMKCTWANISEGKIFVSNVCVTCNSFCELYTSGLFPHVWALP